MHVKFKYYQRVFAILVKSPNAAQLAVEMLLHIEKTAALNSKVKAARAVAQGGGGRGGAGVTSQSMGDLAAAAAAADERDERDLKASASSSSAARGAWGAMSLTTPVPEGGESERDRYLRELLDSLSNPYAVEQDEDDLSLDELYYDEDERTEDNDEWASARDNLPHVSSSSSSSSSGYQNNNNNNNRNQHHNEVVQGEGRSKKHEAFAETLRDLLSFETPPMADPCIYAAVISSLSHNRMAKEACALLRSYVSRG